METKLTDSGADLQKVIEDKLHAIAVQVSRLVEFAHWFKAILEAELKKESEKK